jgi:hypothetical protein
VSGVRAARYADLTATAPITLPRGQRRPAAEASCSDQRQNPPVRRPRTGSSAVVPEPAGALLMCLGLMALWTNVRST